MKVQKVAFRQTSSAKLSSLAIDKYPFMAKLGLKEDNFGCWNGKKWVGNGAVHTAMNPATGEALARVKFGNSDDYESCLQNMQEVSELALFL